MISDVGDLERFMLQLSIPAEDAAKYSSKLQDDGFDVVADLKTMTEQDCVDIGMKKGHLRKIMQAAQKCP